MYPFNNTFNYHGVNYFNNGYQSYKTEHDELNMFIPIHLGIKKGNSIPLINKDSSNISIEIKLANLSDLISFQNINIDEIKFNQDVSCKIIECDFYTKHKYMNGENWMLTISKWPTTTITEYEILTNELNQSNGNKSFTINNCYIKSIYVGFRPIKNFTKPNYWFSNKIISKNNEKKLIDYNQDNNEFIYSESNLECSSDIVKNIKLTLSYNNIVFEVIDHDCMFVSDYKISKLRNSRLDFGPWYIFNNFHFPKEVKDDKFIINIDYKSDRNINFESKIKDNKLSFKSEDKVMMIVLIEKINLLNIDGKKIFNKFNLHNINNIF